MSKAGHVRTKTGCITCKIRRVKCDEAKPACQRCVTTGRTCDGYSSLPLSRRDLHLASTSTLDTNIAVAATPGRRTSILPRLITDPAFSDLLDKRYFQFFRQRTVQSTNALIDCRFWDRLVLQACHREPAIRHAILALSSLHQAQDDTQGTSQHLVYAGKQYEKALTAAQALLASSRQEDLDKVLITCLVFTCFENVRGNYSASAVHTHSGRAIMRQLRARDSGFRREDRAEIERMFARIDLAAITFQNENSPYVYSLEDYFASEPRLGRTDFRDAGEAQAALIDILRWQLLLAINIDNGQVPTVITGLTIKEYFEAKNELALQIEDWEKAFTTYQERNDLGDRPSALIMSLWLAIAKLCLVADFIGPETRYDAHMDHFERIIECAEHLIECIVRQDGLQPHFSPDFGYAPALFMAISRCRDPRLRRRGLAALHKCPRSEGAWQTEPAAAILEKWVEVEEEGLQRLETAPDVPECQRISALKVSIDGHAGFACMRIGLKDENGIPVGERVETITWTP